MPPTANRKRAGVQEYDSDDGFVEDAPKSKKTKTAKSEEQELPEMQKDDEGNPFWELTRLRRLQVSEFKGVTMIGIREYYEKDGKMLPGKKGISLKVEHFNTLVQLLPELEAVLAKKSLAIDRPAYEKPAPSTNDQQLDENAAAEGKANHEATSDEDE